MKTYAEQIHELGKNSLTLEADGPNVCCNIVRDLLTEKVIYETLPALDKFQRNQSRENLIGLAAGIVDSVIILLHAADSFDIPFDAIWDEMVRCTIAETGKPNIFEVVMEYQTKMQMGEDYMKTGMVK